ncbi:MAG: hypothetical protein K2L11_06305 [Muribaculaceae bacterium]|nr:hypothetical protein [Muribaculaceae bacterium]
MKTLYKSIFFCLCLMLGLSACTGKNEEIPPTGGLDHAEQLIAGTYSGTWTSTNTVTGEVASATGTLTFSNSEDLGNNVANVSIVSDDTKAVNLGAKAETSACNVSRLSSGVLSFWNVYALNPFGFTFTGKVTPEGDVTFNYSVAVVIKHKETIYNFEFVGHRQ